MTLQAQGPIIDAAQEEKIPDAGVDTSHRGDDTYTYLRCWYRKSESALEPDSSYEWARNPDNDDWYRVYGYWWADGLLKWENMFYSTATQKTLDDVCRKTLDSLDIRGPMIQALAANNQFSFNYTVWTLDAVEQGAHVNKLIVFGDSLSDTQNIFNASLWKLPNRTSWSAGRFSNGQVWPEYLSHTLDLPMYDWAIGGSATDQYLILPGLLQQVESWQAYMERAPNYRAENTLFAVLAGANDLVNYGHTPEDAANAAYESLNRLASAGARKILLINLPNVSLAPIFATRSDAETVAAQVVDYNQRLDEAARSLRSQYGPSLQLEVFDAYGLFDALFSHPSQYGFDETKQSCLDIPNPSFLSYIQTHEPRPECAASGHQIFWDTLHPTAHTHEWLAEQLASFIRMRFLNYP
jgi:thermolabile hemolysin